MEDKYLKLSKVNKDDISDKKASLVFNKKKNDDFILSLIETAGKQVDIISMGLSMPSYPRGHNENYNYVMGHDVAFNKVTKKHEDFNIENCIKYIPQDSEAINLYKTYLATLTSIQK